MDAMIVVDMQVGLLAGPPKHDLAGVIARINQLTARVRAGAGKVIWVQHAGDPGDEFEPHKPGWHLLPELDHLPGDTVVRKTLNDAFVGTELKAVLDGIAPDRVLIAGWATDFCVDSTVRGAVSNGYAVVVVGDGHTLSDRPHLAASAVIAHQNWVWPRLLTRRSVRVANAGELFSEP